MRRRGSLHGSGALLAKDDAEDTMHATDPTSLATSNGFGGRGPVRVPSSGRWSGIDPPHPSRAVNQPSPVWNDDDDDSTAAAAAAAGRGGVVLPASPTAMGGNAFDSASVSSPLSTPVLHAPVATGAAPKAASGARAGSAGHSASAAALPNPRGVDDRSRTGAGAAFGSVGEAARQLAETRAPRLRRQRLWAEARARRAQSALGGARVQQSGAHTASAPVLPALAPGRAAVLSSGVGLF